MLTSFSVLFSTMKYRQKTMNLAYKNLKKEILVSLDSATNASCACLVHLFLIMFYFQNYYILPRVQW